MVDAPTVSLAPTGSRIASRLLSLASALLVIVCASHADALPAPGDAPPDIVIKDAWDRQVAVAKLGAKPVLVVYEDEASATQNRAFKSELSELAKGDRYKKQVALLAVADLDGYDYWPVRGFVKDAIRDESRKQQLPILCDWDGTFRKSLGLKKGMSNVVLYGKDGKALFSYAGALNEAQRKTLIDALKKQVEPPAISQPASAAPPSQGSSRASP